MFGVREDQANRECVHAGYATGVARYCIKSETISYQVECDDCGSVLNVVHSESYTPSYDPDGNAPYLNTLDD